MLLSRGLPFFRTLAVSMAILGGNAAFASAQIISTMLPFEPAGALRWHAPGRRASDGRFADWAFPFDPVAGR
jgi:hypothetical protein